MVSGISSGDSVVNLVYDESIGVTLHKQKRAGKERSGTGDVFASIIAAGAVQGVPFSDSVTKAGEFVREAIIFTEEHNIPSTDGVYFEPLLGRLTHK